MSKIKTVGSVKSFCTGEWKRVNKIEVPFSSLKAIGLSGSATVLLLPQSAFAAGQVAGQVTDQAVEVVSTVDGTFGNVHAAIMKAFDAGVVLVIIFAGAAWGLGHRTKAIEILLGVCCGYILARHAIDIRDFLKGI